MQSKRCQIVLLFCCTAMLGCTRKASGEKSRKLSTTQRASDIFDTNEVFTDKRILSGGASSTPVKEGMLPLAYVVEIAATVRIVDATSGSVIATADARGRSILSVNAQGVTLGGTAISSEPLNSKHKYVIYLDTAGVNEIRSSKIRSSVKD